MSNLYQKVKRQDAKIKVLENRITQLESELELVRALVLAQKKEEPVPYKKFGPYYDDPTKKFGDTDWWKQQPWMVSDTPQPSDFTVEGMWIDTSSRPIKRVF